MKNKNRNLEDKVDILDLINTGYDSLINESDTSTKEHTSLEDESDILNLIKIDEKINSEIAINNEDLLYLINTINQENEEIERKNKLQKQKAEEDKIVKMFKQVELAMILSFLFPLLYLFIKLLLHVI